MVLFSTNPVPKECINVFKKNPVPEGNVKLSKNNQCLKDSVIEHNPSPKGSVIEQYSGL